ncbi:hypothetical protein INP83_00320 [Mucilaginibacter sp. 21P]|uniref:hypothetical protein n=1 Tax=Mucilaginibacter sp. 21P TaxID=2778902 RepID=UPI001C58701C|nr:hypothetical protein [Mucilaginibacter sp. 21P]QXV65581.1 hypothetical protein INP83_00320 [Mucilaginibacter sp. 21P]
MQLKLHIRSIAAVIILLVFYGCQSQPAGATSQVVKPLVKIDSDTSYPKHAPLTDEKLFRIFISKFKNAVKTHNKAQLQALFHFPLQTSPQWSNEDLKNSAIDYNSGLISATEFSVYYPDIFTKDAVKLVGASGEDDLSEIDNTTTEDYYKKLMPLTDKGSTLYELEKQYTQNNGQETSFGFVFGKIKGAYKVLSYYRPWPLKD